MRYADHLPSVLNERFGGAGTEIDYERFTELMTRLSSITDEERQFAQQVIRKIDGADAIDQIGGRSLIRQEPWSKRAVRLVSARAHLRLPSVSTAVSA